MFLQNKNASSMAVVCLQYSKLQGCPIRSGAVLNNGYHAGGPGHNLTQPNMYHVSTLHLSNPALILTNF